MGVTKCKRSSSSIALRYFFSLAHTNWTLRLTLTEAPVGASGSIVLVDEIDGENDRFREKGEFRQKARVYFELCAVAKVCIVYCYGDMNGGLHWNIVIIMMIIIIIIVYLVIKMTHMV